MNDALFITHVTRGDDKMFSDEEIERELKKFVDAGVLVSGINENGQQVWAEASRWKVSENGKLVRK